MFFICNSSAYAGDIVPNTFAPGEVVSADKMNENFTALENAARPKVKANGVVIGDYIGIEDKGFWVLSENNFIFLINKDGHLFSGLVLFSTPDCTGQRYAAAIIVAGGSFMNIFRDSYNEGVYMLYPTAEKVVIGETYYMESGTCFNGGSMSENYFPVYPNDPNITGVQSSYTAPITLER
jgi:hypothetical protein